ALEALVLAGAFDSIHPVRAELYNSIDIALNYGQRIQSFSKVGQSSIFEISGEHIEQEPKLRKTKPWSHSEKLKKEREVLGFYISGHPLSDYDLEVRSFNTADLSEPELYEKDTFVTACVVINEVKKKIYKETKTMAYVTVEDLTSISESIIFDDAFRKYGEHLNEYECVVLRGFAQRRGDSVQIKISEVIPIEKAIEVLGSAVVIDVNKNQLTIEKLESLKRIMNMNEGNSPVYLNINNGQGKSEKFRLNCNLVALNKSFVNKLNEIFPQEEIIIIPK
ncbi:MAG: hypothetical protein N3A61_06405, partial [Ignavibacteria bacterium]|nr:hypothetical protein [Ignavibacteria bacterium]